MLDRSIDSSSFSLPPFKTTELNRKCFFPKIHTLKRRLTGKQSEVGRFWAYQVRLLSGSVNRKIGLILSGVGLLTDVRCTRIFFFGGRFLTLNLDLSSFDFHRRNDFEVQLSSRKKKKLRHENEMKKKDSSSSFFAPFKGRESRLTFFRSRPHSPS